MDARLFARQAEDLALQRRARASADGDLQLDELGVPIGVRNDIGPRIERDCLRLRVVQSSVIRMVTLFDERPHPSRLAKDVARRGEEAVQRRPGLFDRLQAVGRDLLRRAGDHLLEFLTEIVPIEQSLDGILRVAQRFQRGTGFGRRRTTHTLFSGSDRGTPNPGIKSAIAGSATSPRMATTSTGDKWMASSITVSMAV